MKRNAGFLLFLLIFTALAGIQRGTAQVHRASLDQGISLYRAGQWSEAALQLRRSQMEAANRGQQAESLYWLSLAEFSLGEYAAALRDINELQRIAPAGLRIDTVLYYKGRILYYLNRYDEALGMFRVYNDYINRSKRNIPAVLSQKSVLAYWMGECLYALGQQDLAASQFTRVVNARPRSEKHEAASYRLAMIRQTKIQGEILDMLNWSYAEYLRIVEEYQQREKAYDETINAYRKQVDGMLAEAAAKPEPETERARYERLLAESEAQKQALEIKLQETEKAAARDPRPDPNVQRIRELKASAEKLRSEL
ncbi:tetratricopeptide repeat protein [Treponema primitia]|uniref:tetratricopeptide repeat protein n=1 Tax=Treponema primitia TaxID=88058 RepID=UPI00397FD52A